MLFQNYTKKQADEGVLILYAVNDREDGDKMGEGAVGDISSVVMMGSHGGCSRGPLNLTLEMCFSSTIPPTDVETSSNYIRSMRESAVILRALTN